jgi:hypothetical protein
LAHDSYSFCGCTYNACVTCVCMLAACAVFRPPQKVAAAGCQCVYNACGTCVRTLLACADFVRRRKWLQQAVNANTVDGEEPGATEAPARLASLARGGRQRLTSFVSRRDTMHVTPASAAKAEDTHRTNMRLSAVTAAKAIFSMLQVRLCLCLQLSAFCPAVCEPF